MSLFRWGETAVVTDEGFFIGTVTAKRLFTYKIHVIAVDLGTAAYAGQCFAQGGLVISVVFVQTGNNDSVCRRRQSH